MEAIIQQNFVREDLKSKLISERSSLVIISVSVFLCAIALAISELPASWQWHTLEGVKALAKNLGVEIMRAAILVVNVQVFARSGKLAYGIVLGLAVVAWAGMAASIWHHHRQTFASEHMWVSQTLNFLITSGELSLSFLLMGDSIIDRIKRKALEANRKLALQLEEKSEANRKLIGSLEEQLEANRKLNASLEEKLEANRKLALKLEEKSEVNRKLIASLEEKSEANRKLALQLEEKSEANRKLEKQTRFLNRPIKNGTRWMYLALEGDKPVSKGIQVDGDSLIVDGVGRVPKPQNGQLVTL